MAYADFAYWYDALNGEANYDALFTQVISRLQRFNIREGIVADLGCGTGEMSLRMSWTGYDMIAVDASEDMLAVFREKLEEEPQSNILLLQQDIAGLDLYGTIRAAICTFDTLNHLPPEQMQSAVEKTSLFMEPGGVFIFDANTPYKHEAVLGNQEFVLEDEDGETCLWRNTYLPRQAATQIVISVRQADGQEIFAESFMEYAYALETWQTVLQNAGFELLEVCDGERFAPLTQTSQRYLFTARKLP